MKNYQEKLLSKGIYFASLAALNSHDNETQVGACIMIDDDLISFGYNHYPKGCNIQELDSDKSYYILHAEIDAINKAQIDLNGATLYCTLFPCNECAKLIIESGIKKVVYAYDSKSHKNYTIEAKKLFKSVGMLLVKYDKGI